MMQLSVKATFLGIFFALTLACSARAEIPIPKNANATQFVAAVTGQMQRGEMIVLWDSLPNSYRTDIEQTLQLGLEKIDPATVAALSAPLNDLVGLLRTKKEFILNTPMIQTQIKDPAAIQKAYGPGVDLLEAYLSVKTFDSSKIKSGKIRDVLVSYLDNINKKQLAFDAAIPKDSSLAKQMQAASPKNFSAKVISETATEATVEISNGSNKTQSISLVPIEGVWTEKSMAANWKTNMTQAREQIQKFDPAEAQQAVVMSKLIVEPALNQFKMANDQASFDQAIISALGSISGLMRGLNGPN